VKGDVVLVEAGDVVPLDGEVIEGVASVDESAITGESAPGDARVRGRLFSRDRRHARAVRLARCESQRANPGESFLDRMISDGRGRQTAEDAE
jgi:K+-transporting ATPase ATPase B chain